MNYARYFGSDVRWLADYTHAGGSRAATPELVKFLNRVILPGVAADVATPLR